jgi:cell division protease FtsH
MSRSKLLADLKVAMGGRLAEEIIFGEDKVTTGASSDVRMATEVARRMVTEWAMSDKLGFQCYGEPQQEVFLGHSLGSQRRAVSEKTAQVIDSEVRVILDACYAEARKILTTKLDKLHTLAKGLLEYETLSGEEIKTLLEEGIVRRENEPETVKSAATAIPETKVTDQKTDSE